jgi:adenylosuccinate synthase
MSKKTMILGAQFGSEAKGSVATFTAHNHPYTAAVAAFPPSTGHTGYTWNGVKHVNLAVPVAALGPSIREVFLGPGSILDPSCVIEEWSRIGGGKKLYIHENAAVVLPHHAMREKDAGLTRVGSTAKGGAAAQIDRMMRNPDAPAIARELLRGTELEQYLVDRDTYSEALLKHDDVIIEGPQGLGLSMYHGYYPYTTARDSHPYAIASDCGLPMSWADQLDIGWVFRTFPIRVNNRDGSSGPFWKGSDEVSFEDIGKEVELTTVTQLPRRIATFSIFQAMYVARMASNERSWAALTFCDYLENEREVEAMANVITHLGLPVRVLGYGPKLQDYKVV